MPTFLLLAPVIPIIAILYFLIPISSQWVMMCAPLVPYTILVLIFKHQINWWWYSKHPPKIDQQTNDFLNNYFPYYKGLNEENKRRFGARLRMFNFDKEYISKELREIPGDIRLLTAATAIQTTFGLKDGLLRHWGQLVFYRQPFHTPNRQYFHTGEVHYEDGCIILAVDDMIKGISKQKTNYNIAVHHMALAFQYDEKVEDKDFYFFDAPDGEIPEEALFKKLAVIRGWQNLPKLPYAQLESDELFGICVEHFFAAPIKFKEHLPDMYQALKGILNQDPIEVASPVIHQI